MKPHRFSALRRLAMAASLLPLLALLAAALLALGGCSDGIDRVAGGGGVDVEGITVEGRAMRADKTPVVSARVRLRTWDFQKTSAAAKAAIDGGDTRTDSLGRFRFQDVDTGRYAVEVDAGEDGSTVLEIDADGSQRVLTVEAFVQPQGSISGRVQDAEGATIAGAVVGILGLDREIPTDSAGLFLLTGLPPGVYTLRVRPPSPQWAALEVPLIQVTGGAQTVLDSLVLPAAVAGVRAQWRFDEGKGNVAADARGSLARAVLHGKAGWTADSSGFALSLPAAAAPSDTAGGNNFAFVPKTKSAGLDVDSGADFTLTIWIRTAAAGAGAGTARHAADARTDYAPNGYALGLAADGSAEFTVQAIGSKTELRLAGGTALDDGAWHHLAAGRSGSRFFLLVDGASAGEAEGPMGALTKDNPLYFGSREGKSALFAGLLDDVRLYGRGLTADEAKALAQPTP